MADGTPASELLKADRDRSTWGAEQDAKLKAMDATPALAQALEQAQAERDDANDALDAALLKNQKQKRRTEAVIQNLKDRLAKAEADCGRFMEDSRIQAAQKDKARALVKKLEQARENAVDQARWWRHEAKAMRGDLNEIRKLFRLDGLRTSDVVFHLAAFAHHLPTLRLIGRQADILEQAMNTMHEEYMPDAIEPVVKTLRSCVKQLNHREVTHG